MQRSDFSLLCLFFPYSYLFYTKNVQGSIHFILKMENCEHIQGKFIQSFIISIIPNSTTCGTWYLQNWSPHEIQNRPFERYLYQLFNIFFIFIGNFRCLSWYRRSNVLCRSDETCQKNGFFRSCIWHSTHRYLIEKSIFKIF